MSDLKAKEITFVDPSELDHHPKNTNDHPEAQINYLCKLIEYQGFRNPLVVQKGTNLVVAGNGRLMAARKLGLKQVPVMYQEFDNEAQIFAYIVSDNKIAELAEHNDQKMFDEIKLLPDLNLEMLGIPDLELPIVFEPQADEDAVPEFVEPKTKLGDVYKLGSHRLMCGDSTDPLAIKELMDGETVDMVFTDPPYELETKGGGLLKESKAMAGIKKLGIDKFSPETLSKLADTSIYCCNKPLIPKYIDLANNWSVSWDLCVYHKQNITPNYGGHLMTDLEYIFVIGKQSPYTGMGEDKALYSKLYSGGKDQDNETAWSKPVALCEKFIKLYSKKSVIDIFGGSGSTLIACEKTSRKCFMMELDPHYCDVIITRWEKYTGKKAELINQ